MSEIYVDPTNLRNASAKLSKIASDVQKRNLNISFSYSVGSSVEEIKNLEESLKNLGTSFAELCERTSEALQNIAIRFESEDNEAASEMKTRIC